jgi:predicted acylesterase/phospholipase RssA
VSHAARVLRGDLGFRRVAVLLSGGGTLGAYEVGVLQVLERLALKPALVAGVSSGAINAVIWVAHGLRTAALEDVWLRLRPSSLGMRWATLAMRALGGAALVLALVEVVLTFAGSYQITGLRAFERAASRHSDLTSLLLDATAWAAVAVFGLGLMLLSRRAEALLARITPPGDPHRWHRRLGVALAAGAAVHLAVLIAGVPWPHRFGATVLLFGIVVWLVNRPGRGGRSLRMFFKRLMPETGGRGLWGSAGRRRLLDDLVARGDASRLIDGPVRLVISALAVDSGRTTHFVSWPGPAPEFRELVARALGEVAVMHTAEDVLRATVASSAIPGLFEPVRIAGRDFVDPGGFSNQPLQVAIADGADAMIVVLLSPSGTPAASPSPVDLFELGGRLLEIANWRDMQAELRSLPSEWSRAGDPARMCVVEPERVLPGGVLDFDPAHARELIRRGEADAWRALDRAGWLEPARGATTRGV